MIQTHEITDFAWICNKPMKPINLECTCYMTFNCGGIFTIDNQLLCDGDLGIKDCDYHLFELGGWKIKE